MQDLYSREDIRNTYEPVKDHISTRNIILEYARNTKDIRDVALEGLTLSGAKRVLDLGCSYGFFTEKLKGRLPDGATIVGLDMVDKENRDIFLKTVDTIGYQGEFIHARAEIIRDMKDESFDLIIASYSLYFFPHLIDEIARVLSPDGTFITVTHSRDSLKEVTRYVPRCMERLGLEPPSEIAIDRLLSSFCLENGEARLKPHFMKVEQIIYPNDLLFPLDRVLECISYLDKKKYLIMKDVSENYPQKLEDMITYFNAMVFDHARLHGEVIITKDDAVFRCFNPGRRG